MVNMRAKKTPQPLAEQEIDQIVVAQAEEDATWGNPIRVRSTKTVSVSLSPALATRVAFFARLHREQSIEAWIERIIQERLDLEEVAFAGLKRDLATKYRSTQQEL
jgi:predicted transcriptional regulator